MVSRLHTVWTVCERSLGWSSWKTDSFEFHNSLFETATQLKNLKITKTYEVGYHTVFAATFPKLIVWVEALYFLLLEPSSQDSFHLHWSHVEGNNLNTMQNSLLSLFFCNLTSNQSSVDKTTQVNVAQLEWRRNQNSFYLCNFDESAPPVLFNV